MDANRVLDKLATRLASRVAVLEKEVSILLIENEELEAEVKQINAVKAVDAEQGVFFMQ